MPLEELDGAFMLLGGFARAESSQVSALAGFGVGLSGLESVFAGLEFANHVWAPMTELVFKRYLKDLAHGKRATPKRRSGLEGAR